MHVLYCGRKEYVDNIYCFYDRIAENVSFTLALKTDDDCFVDLENILQVSKSFQICSITQIANDLFFIFEQHAVFKYTIIYP